MQQKYGQLIIYKHRQKNNRKNRIQLFNNEKSSNLKELHKTLYENPHSSHLKSQSGSGVNLLKQPQKNTKKFDSVVKAYNQKGLKEPMKNFYINIERLRNFKISYRDKNVRDASSSVLKKKGIHNDRKSTLLKSYLPKSNQKKQINSSFDSAVNKSINRLSDHKLPQKRNARYQTEQDQTSHQSNKSVNKLSYQNIVKKNYIKKDNQNVIMDKMFIDGYLRGKQLGRGGFSKVWQGFNFKTKQFYAVKQIDTENKYQTHLTQIWFGNYFFTNGEPKIEFEVYPGIKHLLAMYKHQIKNPRAFIVYECCQGSIGNMLYDIYQEDRQDYLDEDDKIYMIKYRPLYLILRKSTDFLKSMIYQIALALNLLAANNIIHSDIKTQNILIKQEYEDNKYHFKLIDYGSSFIYQNLKQYKLATPQYMCPELLNYILFENGKHCHEYMLNYVDKYTNISAIDVWGLGCIALEIIHGLPLWLNNRTKILIKNKFQTRRGLFAVNDRSFGKILQKQLKLIQEFDQFFQKDNNSGIMVDQVIKNLVKRMLEPNPSLRIQPKQIIQILKLDNPQIR